MQTDPEFDERLEFVDNCLTLDGFPCLTNKQLKFLVKLCKPSELDIRNCPNITQIPPGDYLRELTLRDCHNIKNLPIAKNLLSLGIRECSMVRKIPKHFLNLELLTMRYSKITKIPYFAKLIELDLSDCKRLKKLPQSKNLRRINIWDCQSIKEIPFFPLCQSVHIGYMNNIIIPNMPLLQTIYLTSCRLMTEFVNDVNPHIYNFVGSQYDNIPWLRQNPKYEGNINRLLLIQTIKSLVTSKRLSKLVYDLSPFYYDPIAKGGHIHKQQMLAFLENIN